MHELVGDRPRRQAGTSEDEGGPVGAERRTLLVRLGERQVAALLLVVVHEGVAHVDVEPAVGPVVARLLVVGLRLPELRGERLPDGREHARVRVRGAAVGPRGAGADGVLVPDDRLAVGCRDARPAGHASHAGARAMLDVGVALTVRGGRAADGPAAAGRRAPRVPGAAADRRRDEVGTDLAPDRRGQLPEPGGGGLDRRLLTARTTGVAAQFRRCRRVRAQRLQAEQDALRGRHAAGETCARKPLLGARARRRDLCGGPARAVAGDRAGGVRQTSSVRSSPSATVAGTAPRTTTRRTLLPGTRTPGPSASPPFGAPCTSPSTSPAIAPRPRTFAVSEMSSRQGRRAARA